MNRAFIPVNEPLLDGNERKYLNECIDTGWISSEGPFVKRFEESFAERVQSRFGVAVCNGSAALDVAVAALGIGPGDEVIMPTFTIISCAAAVVRAGARPVLVDVDPQTWNMDTHGLEDHVTERTRAIMVVHIFGLPVDMDPVIELARRRGLKIIEDAAQAHGQTYRGRPCGSLGDISTFSFYPNKHVTTGEGGMVTTNDPALASRCRSLRNLCFKPEQRFVHDELGWNYRMTSLQAAVGVAQLERLDEFLTRKRDLGVRYQNLLAGVPGLQLPVPTIDFAQNAYWVFGVVLQDSIDFDAKVAMARLTALGIGTRPFFWPMHEQPVFRKLGLSSGHALPHAERIARRGFYLPSGLALTAAQIEECAGAVMEILR